VNRDEQIREAAYNILGNEGLEALHARTVAAKLGINHATVHYYFTRRIDLLVAVAEYALHQLIRDRVQFQKGARGHKQKIENEIALAEAYCRPQSRFVKVLAGLYVAGIEYPEIRAKLGSIWDEWKGFIEEQLGKAKAADALKADSPYADAELLMATLFGMGIASHMLEEKFDPQKHLDTVFNSLLGE